MPFVNILINVSIDNLQTLNDKTQFPTKPNEGIQGCIQLLTDALAGTRAESVQVTTLNNTISVSTDGGKSQQNTYNKR